MNNKNKLFEVVRKNDPIETNNVVDTVEDTTDFMKQINKFVRLKNLEVEQIGYNKKKKTITFQGRNNNAIVSATIQKTEHGSVETVSKYREVKRKSDYKNDVVELYKNGFKQVEIAQQLGISQSLVSKLLKD